MRMLELTRLAFFGAMIVFVTTASAVAQGFMVKPMRLEVSAQAGRAIEVPLEIRNTAGGEAGAIELRLVELTQASNGNWRHIEPDSGEDVSSLSSSLAWTSLSSSRVNIAPLEPADIMVRFQIPANARGFYFAGIIAETPVPENAEGMTVRVRFLIPVIIEIQGRPVRQRIEPEEMVMTFNPDDARPTTLAHVRVKNNGQTFSRIRAQLRIERDGGDRWRPVTRLDFHERSIIPGVALELGGDLQRRLPSGTYRLRSEVYVDGRRLTPIEEVIEFEGDPNMQNLAYDTALMLEPEMVKLDVVPGATRTSSLRIVNPGDYPVTVKLGANTPRSLIGVEMGDLNGIQLSAEPWTEMRPAEFTLRPGGRQNVRILSRVPREGVQFPNYYADLTVQGTYEDGQSAGQSHSTIHLFNAALPSKVGGAIEQLSIAETDEPSQFVVQMRMANLGTIHLEPSARVFLINAQGRQIRNYALDGENEPLLPLGKRTFSGEVTFGTLEPGYYALRARATLDEDHTVAFQRLLLVERNGDAGETVTVLDDEAVEGLSEEFELSFSTEENPVVTLDETDVTDQSPDGDGAGEDLDVQGSAQGMTEAPVNSQSN